MGSPRSIAVTWVCQLSCTVGSRQPRRFGAPTAGQAHSWHRPHPKPE